MAVDVVQEIKLRTDLVELISTYVPLKRSGRTFKGLCPFHPEKTPSFHVDPERGFFRCYGCGVGGDCFTFIQQKEGLAFHEAGELLARKLGLEWVRAGESAERRSERERIYDMVALAQRYFRERLREAPVVRKYLEQRGLSEATIEEWGLGYAPPGYEALLRWLKQQKVSLEDAERADVILRGEHGLRDRFVDRVIFPIYDLEGRPIAFGGRALQADAVPKYLNTREIPIFQKGRVLYGLHAAKQSIPKSGFAVAVEGYMDVIALHQAGITNAVAGLGTAITESHVGVLRRYSQELVLCYDGDSAGIRAAIKNSTMFETAGCVVRVARLPEGEDPDTYIGQFGADAFRGLLNRAEPLLEYQLNELRGRYNLSDESARLPFVREAARIIAQSGSPLTRQAHAAQLTKALDRLSEEWYPGDPQRALQARTALAQEVSRLLRGGRSLTVGVRKPGAGARRRPGDEPVSPGVSAPVSARVREERYVLRAALTEYRWAERIAQRLRPAHFSDPGLAGVASSLVGNNEDGSEEETGTIAERLDRTQKDPGLAGALSELLIDETPLSDEGLEECIQALERAWAQKRMMELSLAFRAEEGFRPGDPRGEEYRSLLVELGGRQRRED